MKTTVVIPTFNESATIAEAIAGALASSPDVSVLVVDDASPDGTGEIADRFAAREGRVRVMHREAKGGLGPAYRAGFAEVLAHGAEAIVEMDADLSHDPADLPRLIEAGAHADLVIGSRYAPGGATKNWSRARELLSRGGNAYARGLLGVPLRDATSGYRLYRRAVLETLPLARIASEGYGFQVEMAWRAWTSGFALAEIPITFSERRAGASKMSRSIVIEAAWDVLGWAFARKRPPRDPHPRSVRAT